MVVVRIVDQDGTAVVPEEDTLWEDTRFRLKRGIEDNIAAGNNLRQLYPLVQKRAPGTWMQESQRQTGLKYAHINRLMRVAEQAERDTNLISLPGSIWDALTVRDKTAEREAKRLDNAEHVRTHAKPIPEGRFQTVVIDPPWDWSDEGDVDPIGRAKPDYATMSLAEIEALPLGEKAADNAHLYLWIPNRQLLRARHIPLLNAWGFRDVALITWVKPVYGMGQYFRGATEHIVFAVRGSLPLLRHDVPTWFKASRSLRHSAKPDEFYALVESCSPGPRLEFFSRQDRVGWAWWGQDGAKEASA